MHKIETTETFDSQVVRTGRAMGKTTSVEPSEPNRSGDSYEPEARTPGSVGRFSMYRKQTAPVETVTADSLHKKMTDGIMVPKKIADGAAIAEMRTIESRRKKKSLEDQKSFEKARAEKRERNKRERSNKKKGRK